MVHTPDSDEIVITLPAGQGLSFIHSDYQSYIDAVLGQTGQTGGTFRIHVVGGEKSMGFPDQMTGELRIANGLFEGFVLDQATGWDGILKPVRT